MDDWGTAEGRDTFRRDFTRPRAVRRSIGVPRLESYDEREVAQLYHRQRLVRRIRRVAKIAIIATRNDMTSHQRRFIHYKRQIVAGLHSVKQNQYRIVAATMLVVVSIGTFVTPFIQASDTKPILLQDNVKKLIGDTRDDAKSYLKYDEAKKTYAFAVPQDTSDTNFQHTGRNADAYSATLSQDPDGGVVVTDKKTSIAVTVKPDFFVSSARRSTTDNIVYKSGAKQLIYTLKYNGLKEDIIIPSFQGAEQKFTFKLRLPVGVEARLDSEGNIGIYSGDTSLYGSISYGSDQDRDLVNKAREKSEKNNLVMTIPYPIIKQADGTELTDRARFELGGVKVVTDKAVTPDNVPAEVAQKLSQQTTFNDYSLTLKAYNLRDLTYPISIDPTMQVTNAADFAGLNQDNTSIDTTNNLIKRSSLTGGLLGSWSGLANFDTDNVSRHKIATASTSQGNFLYLLGDGSTNVRYASISSTGVLTWGDATNLPALIGAPVVAAYNGYLYYAGGSNTSPVNAVYYAKINSNGTLGNWIPNANGLLTATQSAGGGIYNGYFYVIGGYNGASLQNVQRAKLNGDGSTGTWVNDSNGLSVGRFRPAVSFYNGRVYVTGGINGSTHFNTGVYANLNDDGSLAGWINLPNMTAGRSGHAMSAYGGYLYAWGGCSAETVNVCSTYNATTEFAEIYADGSIGAWRTTNTFTTGRTMFDGTVFNGYIYTIGGCTSFNYTSGSCASGQALQTVQYAQVQPVGTVGSFQSQSNYDSTGREGAAILVARSVIWLFGGYDGTNYLDTIRKATINTDGTINAWSTDGNTLPKAKAYMAITNTPNGAQVMLFGGYGNCGFLNQVDYCNDWETADYGTGGYVSSWNTSAAANLPTARRGITAVFNRNVIYLLGGTDSNGVTNTVWRGRPTTAGLLGDAGCGSGSWCTDISFTNARTDATAIHDNNYIYLIGGRNGATYYRTVQYALINSNSNNTLSSNSCGTSVTWCTTTSINADRSAHSAFVRNGYIYIAGGCNTGSGCTTDLSTIEYAPVNGSSGSLGNWINNPQSFSTGRSYASIGHFDGYMYVLGGNTGASRAVDVQYGYIGNGGTGKLSSFTAPSGAALTSARSLAAVTAYNGYMYIAGGCTAFSSGACTTLLNSLEYAKLNKDGSFSSNTCGTSVTWCSGTPLPDTVYGGQLATYGGYLYYIGGTNSTGVTGNVDSLVIGANGSVGGAWNNAANPPDLVTPRTRFAMTSSDTHVYIINGVDGAGSGISTGEYAGFLPNGTLSNWASFTSGLTSTGRTTLSIANNRLYQVGGSSVVVGFHTAINSDGSISANPTWTQQPWVNTFPTDAVSFVANGYFYYGQGDNILRFSLVSAGGIEPSSENYTYNNSNGVNKHDGGASIYYRGNFYMLGGCDAGYGLNCTALNSIVEYAGQKAIPRLGSFTKLYDFDTGVRPTKLITRGARIKAANLSASYSTTYNTTTTLDTNQSVDIVNYGAANMQTINLGTNRTLSRYLFLKYTLDDTEAAAYPDVGLESTITDFDMYYTSNPGARLRGGRTFTNGVDRGLDAQPQ